MKVFASARRALNRKGALTDPPDCRCQDAADQNMNVALAQSSITCPWGKLPQPLGRYLKLGAISSFSHGACQPQVEEAIPRKREAHRGHSARKAHIPDPGHETFPRSGSPSLIEKKNHGPLRSLNFHDQEPEHSRIGVWVGKSGCVATRLSDHAINPRIFSAAVRRPFLFAEIARPVLRIL